MGKWLNTDNHWSKTNKKQIVLSKWKESRKGKHYSLKTEFKKGSIPWTKNHQHSEEALAKMSPHWFKRGHRPKSWKGGIASINNMIRRGIEFKRWAKAVKKRDNYECQICGTQSGYLHSNHIKKFADYPNERFILSNGITICRSCDIKLVMRHEEEWESYFNFNLKVRGFGV